MASTSYQEIRDSLHQLYVEDPRPWRGDNRPIYKLDASAGGFSLSASNGERVGVRCRFQPHSTLRTRHSTFPACPIQIDISTPSCGNSRFGCWTCTVVERDNWVPRATRLRVSASRRHNSEGLLASGDERME